MFRHIAWLLRQRLLIFIIIALTLTVSLVQINTYPNVNRVAFSREEPDAVFSATVDVNYEPMPQPVLNLDIQIAYSGSGSVERKTCIDSLDVLISKYRNGEVVRNWGGGGMLQSGAVCKDKQNMTTYPLGTSEMEPQQISLDLDEDLYYYPYDSYELELEIRFYGYVENEVNQDFDIPVNTDWQVNIPGREIAYTFHSKNILLRDSTTVEKSFPVFVISRWRLYKLLTPLLIFIIIFFIGLMLFIQDVSAFAESSLAIVFGIVTIRQVLIPDALQSRTLLESVLISLYALMAVCAVYWLYLRKIYQVNRTGSEAQSYPNHNSRRDPRTRSERSSGNRKRPRNNRSISKIAYPILVVVIVLILVVFIYRGQ